MSFTPIPRKLLKSSFVKSRFSNGLTILYLHTKNDPISAAHLILPTGSVYEPTSHSGISTLLWSLFTKGSRKRNAQKMAEDIEALGAVVGGHASHDCVTVSFHSLAEYFKSTLEIVVEALFEPSFNGDEVKKEKNALLASIQSKNESIFTVTHEELNTRLFGTHPYGRPTSGNQKSVSSLWIDQILDWHKKTVTSKNAILAMASHISFSEILPTLEHYFGPASWQPNEWSWKHHPLMDPFPSSPIHIDKKAPFEQAYLMMGFPAPPVNSPRYMTVKLLNHILGGAMSSRLFQQIREKHGMAYEVGSFFPSRKEFSGFYIYLGLPHSKLDEARDQIEKLLQEIQNQPCPEEELRRIKNHLIGHFILDHQTNSQRAYYLGWWEHVDLGSNFDAEFCDIIEAISAEEIKMAAQEIFQKPGVTVRTYRQNEPSQKT